MSEDYVIDEGTEITNDAGTFRVVVLSDPYGTDPREDSDTLVGTMVADSRGYTLPQEDRPGLQHNTVLAAIEDHSFRVVARWLRLFHGANVVLPLYRAGGNHGLTLAAGSGAEDEDADPGNYIGVIFDSAQRWADLGIALDSPQAQAQSLPTVTRDDVVETLRTEVAQYATWAAGEMVAYRIDWTEKTGDDEVWEAVESSGGYFSVDEAHEVAGHELPAVAAQALADHIEELHGEALDENEVQDLRIAEMA